MGGGVMRTAAKVAAVAGFRSTAARRAPSVPSSASSFHVATEGDPVALISVSSDRPDAAAVVRSSAWAIEDWEFAGGIEEAADLVVDPPRRLVFGPAPTFEEAREATSDLKQAMEQVYFSSAAEEFANVSDNEGNGEILPAPNHVIQAFSLLQRSPEAQDIVASLACDNNVWEAVMNNNKVMEFCNKYQSEFDSEVNIGEESVGENENPEDLPAYAASLNRESSEGLSFFEEFVENCKTKVSGMIDSISDLVKDFMGTVSSTCDSTMAKARAATSEDQLKFGVGSSFIALAVAAIMVVIIRRA